MRKVGRIEPRGDGKFIAIIEVQGGEFKGGVGIGGLTEVYRQVFKSEDAATAALKSQGAVLETDA